MTVIQKVKEDPIIKAPFVQEMMEATTNMWRNGWDERNGGNVSFLLKEEEIEPYLDTNQVLRTISLDFTVVDP